MVFPRNVNERGSSRSGSPTSYRIGFEQIFEEKEAYIFGEGFGAGIQKAGGDYVENGTDVSFIIFDINIDGFDLKRESVNDIASRLGIPSVPVVFHGTLDEAKAFVGSERRPWPGGTGRCRTR